MQGFALYMNDGRGGDVFNEIDFAQVRDKPLYTQHTTTAATIVGATYLFKVKAYNINGSVMSKSVAYVIASIPTKPLSAPISDI